MNLVNTTSKVRKQEISVDAVALFDILLIALMMTLLGSKFVSSPGLGLELGAGKDLPKMASPDGAITDADINVLSARGETMLIFDGAIYSVDSFRRQADKNLGAQTLVEICEAAKAAGFDKAVIAATADEK